MDRIIELREQDIFAAAPAVDVRTFKHREAARAVVLNGIGEVLLLHLTHRGFHKLPGGGIEAGEDKAAALAREVMEETGYTIQVTGELGYTLEYRDQWQQKQTSYCYIGHAVGEPQPTALTQEEIDDGFEPMWAPNIDAAIALLEADTPQWYDGQRMKPRDLAILKAAKVRLG